MNNYCYDSCPNNKVPRTFWDEMEEGKAVRHSAAHKGSDTGPKFPLLCELGYRQTVNSHRALVNSKMSGAKICARLRKIFAREEKS